ncbi:F-box only protein 28 isoform X5 [Syngnathoides biaculeatus]|uniref:F-box only protein 28 isoform X5 n=1 Tax=Syngnathoides biaculeatus TaxID=300417 RepID=UPI002ADD9C56|nr:F-box only protein 28 isoform X5 [Syngnathoides biaculeatus]
MATNVERTDGCLGFLHSDVVVLKQPISLVDPTHQNNPLLGLPIVAIETILNFLSYDEISLLRSVCKRMDMICQRVLNQGFLKVERYHSVCQRQVKAQLPRRESERRNHSLARHADILAAVETRLSLLNMTFMKYVDSNLCCFIPGKVIDEIYRVLRYVNSTRAPQRAHEVLQELRDISSMAMEYFDEKIVPILKKKLPGADLSGRLIGSSPAPTQREELEERVAGMWRDRKDPARSGPNSSGVQVFEAPNQTRMEIHSTHWMTTVQNSLSGSRDWACFLGSHKNGRSIWFSDHHVLAGQKWTITL